MGRLFYSVEELLKQPLFPGMRDPTQLYYHFRPARPANLVVTRDPLSGERAALRERLTELIRLIARERWDEVHAYLAARLSYWSYLRT
jgi:hypothetical protein